MATTPATRATLNITSPAFTHEGNIPPKYTCEGENINPPVSIKGIPAETKSLVLIVDDPDAPWGTFTHWTVWNIHPTETIAENSLPGINAKNSRGQYSYTGPCPPSGTHRYYFKVFALNTTLDLDDDADRKMVEDAMKNHIIASGELMGLYKRQEQKKSIKLPEKV